MLSLRVEDVIRYGKVVGRIRVLRANMKGNDSRDVELTPFAEKPLLRWIQDGLWRKGHIQPRTYLFRSQVGKNRAISRRHAYRILKDNFIQNCITGPTGTHSMRKTFAKYMHENFIERARTESIDPFFLLVEALGHANPSNTAKYISFEEEHIVKSMNDFQSNIFGGSDA
jgi:integrase